MAADRYVSCELSELLVGEPLPVPVHVYLDYRFITFRGAGDRVDRATYDKLQFKKVRYLFVAQSDLQAFVDWTVRNQAATSGPTIVEPSPERRQLEKVRSDVHRKMLDIFQEEHPDRHVAEAIEASRRIVDEIMKFPLTVKPLADLQVYSQGTVDHSINVSILSVYLAIQMGYSHNVILQHLAMGALLHDLGKTRVPLTDDDTPADIERKMRDHPTLGLSSFENQSKIPNEVKMIMCQHHECWDGSGYPKGLRGNSIYDLARIVSIANIFDELVGNSQGPLPNRQKEAVRQLDEGLFKKFDPQKLDKALKVLKMGV